ncbi:N-acetylglucosamine-6-sulfatase [Fusarium albosuccineum]|uniref:N-acetylglucosamine-6-sulfatase n=1 Tax=Fusarium albosuccineum TaxID=1237068 RepID=A0A8H4PA30_9HYPO|nr:N-acetylglucosamine-6-sulfatase [Fusarium albosuccineum]
MLYQAIAKEAEINGRCVNLTDRQACAEDHALRTGQIYFRTDQGLHLSFVSAADSCSSERQPYRTPGYATDIITDKSIDWMKKRDPDRPFFLMCHHKAPHRSWEHHYKHSNLYTDPIKVPDTFTDDYKNRARAAAAVKMRVAEDLTYFDLGLVEPEGPRELVGEKLFDHWTWKGRKIPQPDDVTSLTLRDKATGQVFTFTSKAELAEFKFQRYMQRYLRTIHSIDENVGRMLGWLDQEGIAENTIVVYTSDQGFFLGEHGWCDKRFMYEESFQMPFLIRYPKAIKPGSVCDDIICNVDFAPTFCDLAGVQVPSYMQGTSFKELLHGQTPKDWQQVAFHRYWMHNDAVHNAYAHYGVRDQRYKLVYWYNEDLGIEGARPGGPEKEWELFDCVEATKSQHVGRVARVCGVGLVVFISGHFKYILRTTVVNTHPHVHGSPIPACRLNPIMGKTYFLPPDFLSFPAAQGEIPEAIQLGQLVSSIDDPGHAIATLPPLSMTVVTRSVKALSSSTGSPGACLAP